MVRVVCYRSCIGCCGQRCVVVCYRRCTGIWIRNFADSTSFNANRKGHIPLEFDVKLSAFGHLGVTSIRNRKS